MLQYIQSPAFFNALLSWPTVLCSGLSFISPAIPSILLPYVEMRGLKYLISPEDIWREPVPDKGTESVVEPVADAEMHSSSKKR